MRRITFLCVVAISVFIALPVTTVQSAPASDTVRTQSNPDSLNPLLEAILARAGATVSGEWFIAYENGFELGTPSSNFFINRGYINVRKQLLPWLSGRITPDISVDRQGDGEGDLELRLKYCFVRADLPALPLISAPAIVFGLAERPWLGFEQKVNRYRVQGNMYVEREGIQTSADFGVSFEGLIGGEMDEHYKRDVASSWAGRYGSYVIGFYNGGGYHAIEWNHNKTIEGRLTLRPLPFILPGLQCTYSGAWGKGNTEEMPDWRMNIAYLSYEHSIGVLTATYLSGSGDSFGRMLDASGTAMPHEGYSVFGEVRLGFLPVNMFGRYDMFTSNPGEVNERDGDRLIVGAGYRIAPRNMLLLDYELDRRYNDVGLRTILKLSMLYRF
ncbi:MAG: hypothetical protein KFH87_03445 [Bacteroidetes bacterium]|nr:hypothetical protein [Bacteroidota bacterium]